MFKREIYVVTGYPYAGLVVIRISINGKRTPFIRHDIATLPSTVYVID